MKKGIKYECWMVLFSALLINFILGFLYCWSELKFPMQKLLGWTPGQIKHPFALATFLFALSTFFGGLIQDKKGPKYVSLSGGILFGLGLLLSGFLKNYTSMLLTFGVMCGTGMGLCFSTTIPCVLKWFNPLKKGMLIGVIMSVLGLAPLYMDLLTNYLIKFYGIKSFSILGAVALIIIPLLSILLKNPSTDSMPSSSNPLKDKNLDPGLNWMDVLQYKQFYFLFFTIIFSSIASLMVIGPLSYLAHLQSSWNPGFKMAIIITVSIFIGRIFSGILYDKAGFTKSFIFLIIIQIINLSLFWSYSNIPLIILGAAFTGFVYGAIFTLFPAIIADLFGIKNFGGNFGLIFIGWGIAGAITPIFRSKFFIIIGAVNVTYIIAAVLFLISILFVKNMKIYNKEGTGVSYTF